MLKSHNRAHNIEMELQKISHQVFDLDDSYKGILYTIALNGPLYIGQITKLSKKNLSAWEVEQKQAYRRILGTKRLFGLLEKEYLFSIPVKQKKRGHPNRIFCLTLKGMLAALSTKIELEKIYLFKNYIEFICAPLKHPELKAVIKNFIKDRIFLFLAWHGAHNIQLQQQIGSRDYFEFFFNNLKTDFLFWYPANLDEEKKKNYEEILNRYVDSSRNLYILDMIGDSTRGFVFGEEASNIQKFLFENFTYSFQFDLKWKGHTRKSGELLIGLIQKWPFYMENLQILTSKRSAKVSYLPTTIDIAEAGTDKEGYAKVDVPAYSQEKESVLRKFMNDEMLDNVISHCRTRGKDFEGEFRIYQQTRPPRL